RMRGGVSAEPLGFAEDVLVWAHHERSVHSPRRAQRTQHIREHHERKGTAFVLRQQFGQPLLRLVERLCGNESGDHAATALSTVRASAAFFSIETIIVSVTITSTPPLASPHRSIFAFCFQSNI